MLGDIPADIPFPASRVAVVGAGVIGASWVALLLAHGHDVVVHDPRPDAESFVRQTVATFEPTLNALGLSASHAIDRLDFARDLETAVGDAAVVQENGPERLDFKRELWARIERAAPADALLLSSSSALTATQQAREMKDPSRMLIGHPFNPPHLIPLVEVAPGEGTSPGAVQEAVAFYRALGKVPVVLRKEIRGFVANRLQSAFFKECCHLVLEGVVSVDELDDIVTGSLGLRWAADGPFRSFHMAGGPGGFDAYFAQFAPALEVAWKHQPDVTLDEAARNAITEQAKLSFAREPVRNLEEARDAKQVAMLRALRQASGGDDSGRFAWSGPPGHPDAALAG